LATKAIIEIPEAIRAMAPPVAEALVEFFIYHPSLVTT
jgi:hypothetical protein